MSRIYKLFDIFSANLKLYRNDCRGLFICPLCLCLFSRDQIRSDLSKAHIIPQSLGGRAWTLTCETCNNNVGSEIESYESERANFNWALSGNGNETTRVEIWYRNGKDGVCGPVLANMKAIERDGDRVLQLFAKQKGSNPAAWKLFNDINSGKIPAGQWSQEVSFRMTKSSKRANLTYVHAAYLYMFHQFGYEWIFTPGDDPQADNVA